MVMVMINGGEFLKCIQFSKTNGVFQNVWKIHFNILWHMASQSILLFFFFFSFCFYALVAGKYEFLLNFVAFFIQNYFATFVVLKSFSFHFIFVGIFYELFFNVVVSELRNFRH